MKKLLKRKVKGLVCIVLLLSVCLLLNGQRLDPDGTRFYWFEDFSGNTEEFLEKFEPANIPSWVHAASRIDGFAYRRGSTAGINIAQAAKSKAWTGWLQFASNTPLEIGMNTGLPNHSWEYPVRNTYIQRFAGDLGIIRDCKEMGFTKMTMFMQSVLSKGNTDEFDPTKGGANLDQRVQDCVDYATYILANKPQGIDLSFVLIDAFPQKRSFPTTVYRQAYKKLVLAYKEKNISFDGFIFDMKTDYIKSNVKNLTDEALYIETTLSQETGVPLYAGWYSWTTITNTVQANTNFIQAMDKIKTDPNGKYVSRIWLAGNSESGNQYPDYVNGNPISKLERFNQAFCILENIATNPTKAGDPIVGPVNTLSAPPIAPSILSPTILSNSEVLLEWKDGLREKAYKIYRYTQSKDQAVLLAELPANTTGYTDRTAYANTTFTYFLEAYNEFGKVFSPEQPVTITNTAPQNPVAFTSSQTNCYSVQLSWQDQADNEAKYVLTRYNPFLPGDSIVRRLNANTTNYIDESIQAGIAYQYKIQAINHIGTSDEILLILSNDSCLSKPNPPASVQASRTFCKEITLKWNDTNANEDGLEIQFKKAQEDWTSIILPKNTTSWVNLFPEEKTFVFRLRSFNTIAKSEWSQEVNSQTISCNCTRGTFNNNGIYWKADQLVQAENFDYCANGVKGQKITYFEPDEANQTGDLTIRPNESIDLFVTTVGTNSWKRTGSVQPLEYYEYSFDIQTEGFYSITARVAAIESDRLLRIFSNNEVLTFIDFEGTDDWKNYFEVESETFFLAKGEHTIRIQSISGGTDMDWFMVKTAKLSSTNSNDKKFPNLKIYPNPATEMLYLQTGVTDGRLQARLLNGLGQTLKTFPTIEKGELKLQGITPGVYWLEIQDDSRRQVEKVVIR